MLDRCPSTPPLRPCGVGTAWTPRVRSSRMPTTTGDKKHLHTVRGPTPVASRVYCVSVLFVTASTRRSHSLGQICVWPFPTFSDLPLRPRFLSWDHGDTEWSTLQGLTTHLSASAAPSRVRPAPTVTPDLPRRTSGCTTLPCRSRAWR